MDLLEIMKEADDRGAVLRAANRGIANFKEKLDSLVKLIANTNGLRTSMRRAMMEEAATTSEFPLLFGTILDRQLLAKYQITKPDWRAYIKTGTQMDFRPQEPIGVYGLQSGLNAVVPRDEYKQDAVLGTGKVLINLTKYGRRFGIGWETIINDDLGAFADIADRLSNAALRTEYREATKLIADANGPNALLFGSGAGITHPIDGKKVINKFTGAGTVLSVTNLGLACQVLRTMKDSDGEPIMIEGFELVVPPQLEVLALTILHSALVVAAGGDSTAGKQPVIQGNANVVASMSITLHVNPYLPIIDTTSGTTAWYLFAKLSSGASVQLNFLRGHESPELTMKNPNKVTLGGGMSNPFDGDFESDAIDWRVRHILGGVQVDPRYGVAYVGA